MTDIGNTELSTTYQKKTQKEHIKDAPDTYVGAIDPDQVKNWSFSKDNTLAFATYTWTPALYKIFDEAIVNCRDHFVRLMQKIKNGQQDIMPVTLIDVSINQETGVITLMNDGNGIDIGWEGDKVVRNCDTWGLENGDGTFMKEIKDKISKQGIIGKNAIPEEYDLLRTIQMTITIHSNVFLFKNFLKNFIILQYYKILL